MPLTISSRLEDPNSSEHVQPNCGSHCFLTGEIDGLSRILLRLHWSRHTDLRTLCFVTLMNETNFVN